MKSPLELTIAEWNRLSPEAKQEARKEVLRLVKELRKEERGLWSWSLWRTFVENLCYDYILVLGTLRHIHGGGCLPLAPHRVLPHVTNLVNFAIAMNQVPFELFEKGHEGLAITRANELDRVLAKTFYCSACEWPLSPDQVNPVCPNCKTGFDSARPVTFEQLLPGTSFL